MERMRNLIKGNNPLGVGGCGRKVKGKFIERNKEWDTSPKVIGGDCGAFR